MKNFKHLIWLAIVTYAPQIEDIRDKIGNIVHTRGRSGSVLRARVKPTNPRSADQVIQRGFMTTFSKAWRSLTTPNQQAWIQAAAGVIKNSRLAKKYTSTGNKMFIEVNINAYDNGASAQISSPITPTATPVVEATAINFDTTTPPTVATVTTGANVATNSAVQIWATPQLSNGVFAPGKKFRLLKVLPGGTTAGVQNIKSDYETRFGTIQAGYKVFIRLVTFNNDAGKCGYKMGSSEVQGQVK
jgi:hypothetical protein